MSHKTDQIFKKNHYDIVSEQTDANGITNYLIKYVGFLEAGLMIISTKQVPNIFGIKRERIIAHYAYAGSNDLLNSLVFFNSITGLIAPKETREWVASNTFTTKMENLSEMEEKVLFAS